MDFGISKMSLVEKDVSKQNESSSESKDNSEHQPEKNATSDKKFHKITKFFPFIKLDGKQKPCPNSDDSSPITATASSFTVTGFPQKFKFRTFHDRPAVHVVDVHSDPSDTGSSGVRILKSDISQILRTKMRPGVSEKDKSDHISTSLQRQSVGKERFPFISEVILGSGKQSIKNDDVSIHSSCTETSDEKDCDTASKPLVINSEPKIGEMQGVYKARKGGPTYSAKTFTSTSASGTKPFGKGHTVQRTDSSNHQPRKQATLPNPSSPSSNHANQDSQQSIAQSQNSALSDASSGLHSHPEVRSNPKYIDRSFAPSSIKIPSHGFIAKRNRRRHFKGSTYSLYLSPSKRRKHKKKNSDASCSVKDDESSIAGTENGSFIDSEGDNSIYSDYYSPSEKSLLGDEPVSPGRSDCCSVSETQKSSEISSSHNFLNASKEDTSKSFENIGSHAKIESLDTASRDSLSNSRLQCKANSSYLNKDFCESPEIKIKKEVIEDIRDDCGPPDVRIGESLSKQLENGVLSSANNTVIHEDKSMPKLTKHEFTDVTMQVEDYHSTFHSNEKKPEIINLSPSIPPVIEASPDNIFMANGTTSDNAVSTIAKSVKSRQRIKRRFTDDIVDTDAGILSLNCMSSMKRGKDQPSVSPKAEVKIGHGSKVECVVDMKLPPVALCTCQAKSISPKNIASQVHCQAVDSFYDLRIGCSGIVKDLKLVRCSVKNPFVFMCRQHLYRFGRHHSCPVCGLFCTSGRFITCQGAMGDSSEYHYFHERCMTAVFDKRTCLHCGNCSNLRLKELQFLSSHIPTFSHKQVLLSIKARITAASCRRKLDEIMYNKGYVIRHSGKSLSSVGLPLESDRLKLDAMLAKLSTEKLIPKYSIMEMPSAVSAGEYTKVLHMLALGFDPNHRFHNHEGEMALHIAAASGNLILVHLLIQSGAIVDPLNDRLYTPLMLALENQNQNVINYLVKAGAQLQSQGEDGMTCLHLAAKSGHVEMTEILLNAKTLNINIQDDGGWTSLVWATEHKHLEVVKLLVHRGADPNITDNEGNIGLHWSAFSGSSEICQLFLSLGCDVNAVNEHGDTPLHIAARQDYYECIWLFLTRMGNSFVLNKAGKTPRDCCISQSSETYLALNLNMNLKNIISKFNHRCERVFHCDISKGREKNPIQCVNAVDDEPAPFDYIYVLENCETSPINFDRTTTTLSSCKCVKDCYSSDCACGNISFRCWYDKDGYLIPEFNFLDPPLIFECNRTCTCWRNCGNRIIQNGIVCRLQLMRTKGKGWGVRTLKDIPKGVFICEYVGELITDHEADSRAEDSYLFDLDYKDGDTFCLDAHFYGNISRFINHLCEPNIIPVKAFIDHQDLRYPRIAFFSSREIKAYEELGFDYGEKFWSIKYKSFTCHCNSPRCKYSKDTVLETLASYNRRIKEEAG